VDLELLELAIDGETLPPRPTSAKTTGADPGAHPRPFLLTSLVAAIGPRHNTTLEGLYAQQADCSRPSAKPRGSAGTNQLS